MASATTLINRALEAAAAQDGGPGPELQRALGDILGRGLAERLTREAASRLDGPAAAALDHALKLAAYRLPAMLKPGEGEAPTPHTLIPFALHLRLLRTDPLRPGLDEPPARLTDAVYFLAEQESLREHFDLPGYISYFIDPALYAPSLKKWANPQAARLYLNAVATYARRGGGTTPRLSKRPSDDVAEFTVGDEAEGAQVFDSRVLCVTLFAPSDEADEWTRYLFGGDHAAALAHVGEMAALDLSATSPAVDCPRLSELWRVPQVFGEIRSQTTPANLDPPTAS